MGDVVIRKDLTRYRIETGEWFPFDEANPPTVPAGIAFSFLPIYGNQGAVTRNTTLAAAITDPLGQPIEPQWFLDPTIPRPLDPGVISGIGFFFVPQVAGDCTVQYEVYADNILSDSWQVVVCTVADLPPDPGQPPPSPPPPPPPSPETGAFVGLIGMVLIAELVAGLAEGIVE